MSHSLIGYTEDFDTVINGDSIFIRGVIINAITSLERTIDAFLSIHFCKDEEKAQEIIATVFASKYMTFEGKRQIFNYIIIKHHAEYKKLNLKNIHAELERFNNHRNILAHCILDIKPESVKLFHKTGQVTFLSFDKEIKQVKYTKQEALKLSGEIYDFIRPIMELLNKG